MNTPKFLPQTNFGIEKLKNKRKTLKNKIKIKKKFSLGIFFLFYFFFIFSWAITIIFLTLAKIKNFLLIFPNFKHLSGNMQGKEFFLIFIQFL